MTFREPFIRIRYEAVNREIEPVVQRYRSGDRLIIPTSWHIAVAYAS